MDLQLTDKLALVSGSTAGIDMAIAKKLASEGASVIVNGRSQEYVDKAIESLSNIKGTVMGRAADLGSVVLRLFKDLSNQKKLPI